MTADLLYWIVLFLILVIGFLILRFCKEKIKVPTQILDKHQKKDLPRFCHDNVLGVSILRQFR